MKRLNEQITGNVAMVFHGSENKEVYKYICEGQWICSNGVYGEGLYSVYNLEGTNTQKGGYGKYVLKLYIKDLSKYWCFNWDNFQKVHPLWAKHTNEDDFIDYQAEKFNLKQDEYPKGLGNLYEQYENYPEFLEYVDGIIYHGTQDGDCILHYNPYNCRPLAISSDKGKTWEKIDEEYIQQYKQTLSNLEFENFHNGYSESSTINIPNYTDKIGDYYFEDCTFIKTIIIPNSVIKIGKHAFSYCINLKNINIPNSVTEIGECAFHNCKRLTNIIIPDSITEIKSFTFANCIKLCNVIIPDSVTKIGEYAFNNCKSLKNINIPDSVTEIGNCTFSTCDNLTNVTIPSSVVKIGEYAFNKCPNLRRINYKGTEDEWNQIEGIDKIGWNGIINFNA